MTGDLLWRIRCVLAHRGWRARHWCREAELSESYLSQTLSRLEQGLEVKLSADTIRKLASAAGIREAWLAHGEGAMESNGANGTPRSKKVDKARANLDEATRQLQPSPRALALMGVEFMKVPHGQDLSVEAWTQLLEEAEDYLARADRIAARFLRHGHEKK